LEAQGAHNDLVQWAAAHGEDWEALWNGCPRGDWLLAIAARAGVEPMALTRASAAAARVAFEVPLEDTPEKQRAEQTLDALEATPEMEDDERRRRMAEMDALGEDSSIIAMASGAVRAALATAEDPSDAPSAVTFAVQASLLDAGDCALMAVVGYTQKKCADAVRGHIPFSAIEPLIVGKCAPATR